MSILSEKLREKRRTSGLKVQEVLDRLKDYGVNISDKTLYHWENGKRNPNADEFFALCEIYEVESLNEFRGTEKSPEPEGSGEKISMDESNRLFDALVSAGLIRDNIGFSDDDRAFLNHIFGLLDIWCRSKGQ